MAERDPLLPALDDALAALQNGASLERVLAANPALAGELRPLLIAALSAGAAFDLSRVPASAQAASRAQFLAAAAHRRPGFTPVAGLGAWLRGRSLLARAMAVGALVLAGLSVGGYGAVAASAQSLPGDALYGVKRTVETTELLLAADPQARARLQTEFDERRVHEAQRVVSEGRQVPVEFTGTLISMNGPQAQQWLVSGIAVQVGPQVPVVGTPLVGGRVHIQGMVQTAGLVQAQRVTVLPDEASTLAPTPTPTATVVPTNAPTATATETTMAPAVVSNTPAPTIQAPAATVPPTASPTLTNALPPTATLAPTATDDHGGGPGPSASNTPEATQDQGGGPGPSASNTPEATQNQGGGPGPSASNTPEATEDHSGGGNTPEPTDDGGDHGGGGGPSPSNTPKPSDGGGDGGSSSGGGGPSPSNTPQPED